MKRWPKYLRLRQEVMKSRYLKMSVSSGYVRNAWKAIKSSARCNSTVTPQNINLEADDFSRYFSSVFQVSDSSSITDLVISYRISCNDLTDFLRTSSDFLRFGY